MSISRHVISSQVFSVLMLSLFTASAQQSCVTPNGANGECVSFRRCTFVTQAAERYGSKAPEVFKSYVLRSRCDSGSQEIYLCCDVSFVTPDSSATTSTTTSSTTAATNVLSSDAVDFEASLNPKGLEILNAQECGKSSADRIAYGEKTNLFEFPWMAQLRYDDPEGPFKCGGTLITSRHVLTASHCVVRTNFKLIGVRLGEHDTSTDIDCQVRGRAKICAPPVEDLGVEEVISHPSYSRNRMEHDVALIKLNVDVEFKRHIKPICLPVTQKSAQLPADERFLVAGWGTTETGSVSNILMKATIPYKTRQTCQAIFKRSRITENHLCAGGDERVDSCKGDSGGPLFNVVPYRNSAHFVQYGIVSFGADPCGANQTYPGVYSNIVQLMPWITSSIV